MGGLLSFHGGHSGEFCHHAEGVLADVVAAAVEAGFRAYGLAEHMPPASDADRYPDEVADGLTAAEMQARFDRYAREVAPALRARYADRMPVFVGMETEVVPDGYLTRVAEFRERYALEYVVGSLHHVGGLGFDMSAAQYRETAEALGGCDAMCRRYFEAQGEMIEGLRPEVVGHLDLILKYAEPDYRLPDACVRLAHENLDRVAATGGVLDVNGRAPAHLGTVYPSAALLREARRRGIGVTLGDDSHGPAQVGRNLDACLRRIREAGYDAVMTLARTGDGVVWQPVPLEELPC